MDEEHLNAFLRISVSMATIGAAMGIASWLAFEWIVATGALGDSESIALPLIPLIMLLIVTATAPLVSGILGIFEGLRQSDLERAVVAAFSGLFGGVIFIVIAALFISQMDAGGSGAGPTLADIVTLAGLSGVACALAACITTILNKR